MDSSKVSFLFAGGFFRLPFMFGFDIGFQVVQTGGPENAVLLDPRVDGAQWLGIEVINAIPSFPVFTDKMGAAEQTKVL